MIPTPEIRYGHFAYGGAPWGGFSAAQLRALRRGWFVWLAEISLRGAGAPVLRLSDRNIDYDVYRWDRYIASVSGIGISVSRMDAFSLNDDVRIEFINAPWGAFAYLSAVGGSYPFDGAAVRILQVPLDDSGLLSEAALVFKGYLDQPEGIGLDKFTCQCSSKEFAADLAY